MINGMTNKEAAFYHYKDGVCADLRKMESEIARMVFDEKTIPPSVYSLHAIGNHKHEGRLYSLSREQKPRRARVAGEICFIRELIAMGYGAISKCYAPRRPDAE